jgi:hypothetical protein
VRAAPEFELQELMQIYEHDGLSPGDARLLVMTLARYPQSYHDAMVANELGINTLEPETVKLPAALTIGVAYAGWFDLSADRLLLFPGAGCTSYLAGGDLHRTGGGRCYEASINLYHSVVEIVVIGILSAGGGYVVGTAIPHLFGY